MHVERDTGSNGATAQDTLSRNYAQTPIPSIADYGTPANLANPRLYRVTTLLERFTYHQYVPLPVRQYSAGRIDIEKTVQASEFCKGEESIARTLLEAESKDPVNIESLANAFSTVVAFDDKQQLRRFHRKKFHHKNIQEPNTGCHGKRRTPRKAKQVPSA